MEINFIILGNHEDPAGNPVPYTRVVGRALWTPNARRYAAWKEYVVRCFFKKQNLAGMPIVIDSTHGSNYLALMKKRASHPIILDKNQKARMDLKIFWKNGAHADPDNVFKGIADSLFKNDKNLDGSFSSELAGQGEGRVEVKINIE